MPYFTWEERALTADTQSIVQMAERLEEAAQLLRQMADRGFMLERIAGQSRLSHGDPAVFAEFDFVDEAPPSAA